jgi:serine-type D-Ala-D-Ala carboxypeptidase (penicillin-binding protein 5/6)
MRLSRRLAACATMAGLAALPITAALVPAQPAAAATAATGATAARAATAATGAVRAAVTSGPSGILALGADLENAGTGKVLWSRDVSGERPMGSITKVMTALVVIEAGDLSREIKVPAGIIAYDNKYGGSTAGLRVGDVLTARQLLYAMLIPSGCDAAYTLAYAYGHTRAGFIAMMNQTARKLGLTRTHFSDFSGLPDPTEYSTYSTPANLVKLGLDAMKLPLFRQIVRLTSYHIAATSRHLAYTWQNTNPLLGNYPGAIGIKTGDTNAAGDCLLFEAVRGRTTLIGVVLHSTDSGLVYAGDDAITLLNWGFSH